MAKHNEHRIDAAIRETYEETGCKVVPVKQLRKSDNANYYLCQKIGGHAAIKSHEILEVKWFSFEEVKALYENKLLVNCSLSWFRFTYRSINGKGIRQIQNLTRAVRPKKKNATLHFISMINQGFRVYDCLFAIAGSNNLR